MNSRERVLLALNRKAIDRVPYVETAIDISVGEKLLNLYLRERKRQHIIYGDF